VLVYKIAKRFKRNPQIPPGMPFLIRQVSQPSHAVSSRLSAPGSFALLKTAYRIEPKGRERIWGSQLLGSLPFGVSLHPVLSEGIEGGAWGRPPIGEMAQGMTWAS
jgi:hypothetical protein